MPEVDSLQRYRLAGDEDCGVGLHCRDCWDGGRPIAYYDGGLGPCYDSAVQNVSTIPGLLEAAASHERDVHGG